MIRCAWDIGNLRALCKVKCKNEKDMSRARCLLMLVYKIIMSNQINRVQENGRVQQKINCAADVLDNSSSISLSNGVAHFGIVYTVHRTLKLFS